MSEHKSKRLQLQRITLRDVTRHEVQRAIELVRDSDSFYHMPAPLSSMPFEYSLDGGATWQRLDEGPQR